MARKNIAQPVKRAKPAPRNDAPIPLARTLEAARRADISAPPSLAREAIASALLALVDPCPQSDEQARAGVSS